jgi:hypothetical protein
VNYSSIKLLRERELLWESGRETWVKAGYRKEARACLQDRLVGSLIGSLGLNKCQCNRYALALL